MPAQRQLESPNPATTLVRVGPISNAAFLEQYAAPGRVMLSTGTQLIDKAIARAQKSIEHTGRWGTWSHAVIFQGRRLDGHHWLVESDMDVHRKHIRLGAQENRVTKYHKESLYESLAVLDFGLSEEQARTVLIEALHLVADRTHYSLRETVGAWLSLHNAFGLGRTNLIERDRAFFCSAFVMHLYRLAGVDLSPGLATKAVAPDDLFRSIVPHKIYLLARALPRSSLAGLKRQLRVRLKAGARQIRSGMTAPIGL